MALIECPDCSKKVSDSAPACPNCGRPIASAREAQAAGVALTTIQETSKKLKAHQLISVLLIMVGTAWFFVANFGAVSNPANESISSFFSVWFVFIGLIWFTVTRLRVWWHHK